MGLFFRDIHDSYSWDTLIADLSITSEYNPYCNSNNYYTIFKHIIISLIKGREVILLDSDFSNDELMQLTGISDFREFTEISDNFLFSSSLNKDELISKLRQTSDTWKITIYTSGTTGIPKKVTHNFSSIIRFVKTSEKNHNCVWGFAFNPTHIAGVQVFLQALLNGNSIVRLFGLSQSEIYHQILQYEITHISATPTFYRLLLPCDKVFESVIRITSGGEKFNQSIIQKVKLIFPKALITNVYASTEAGSLFASDNDIFIVKSEYHDLVQIRLDELYIHNSLLGISDNSIGEWYNTQDLVEVISLNPLKFKFMSRRGDMINVGGYKVNPLEVEEVLMEFSGIQNVLVYSKTNSVIGNIICCDVVCNNEICEADIRVYLQKKIQEFKIPRIIRFVDKILTTKSGKVKRV
jgi:acyl-coenzyme A synthetase/AMP-(fatty) acid ligase